MPYSNITLSSLNGDLSVVLYLPVGIKSDESDIYYYGSRFDHGSMIGHITRKRRYAVPVLNDDGAFIGMKDKVDTHVLYGTNMWRQPHNSQWPESGAGLASEFGVGDDGATCLFRCGWPEESGITNGLLGYQEAANGESFLKIGVGALVKGSCPACDSTDDYRFNSPYLFASTPRWKLTQVSKNSNDEVTSVKLEHSAFLRSYGYNLKKDIQLNDNVLSVTMTLQNLGSAPFSTVWYSHHFFTCDGNAVGPGYSLDVDLNGESMNPVYAEPGTWSWATPLDQYSDISIYPNSVHIEMKRALDPGTRIKAEFLDDHDTKGGFTISACDTSIEGSIESDDLLYKNPNDYNTHLLMYAYNLYIERGTFSPEPQILIRNLQPGQETTWTLKLVIKDNADSEDIINAAAVMSEPIMTETAFVQQQPWWNNLRGGINDMIRRQNILAIVDQQFTTTTIHGGGIVIILYAGVVMICCLLLFTIQRSWRRRYRRRDYVEI